MKRIIRFLLVIIVGIMLSFIVNKVLADPPEPPPPPSGHGRSGNASNGPVGDGLSTLLVLGLGYSFRKLYRIRKEKTDLLKG